MTLNLRLFDIINGLAGQNCWFDRIGQLLTIYGLLAGMLLLATLFWWSRMNRDRQFHFLRAFLITTALCALSWGLEWFLASHILHHDLRARPANAHWATLLVTERSSMSFPAWPVLFLFAMGITGWQYFRRAALLIISLGFLVAFSLVYVGVNYPDDVITGAFVGIAIGMLPGSMPLQGSTHARRQQWLAVAMWLLVLVWGGGLLVTTHASRAPEEPGASASTLAINQTIVQVPETVLTRLQNIVARDRVTVQAATNGHLTVGWIRITLPDSHVTVSDVENTAKQVCQLMFSRMHPLDLITVEIDATFSSVKSLRSGTLFTVTIERAQWYRHTASGQIRLPGKKYFHPQFFVSPP